MVKRNYCSHFRRFTLYIIVLGWLVLALSCVSMSKYKTSENNLANSEKQRKELSAKLTILQNDTTECKVKVRSLQNDINYIQNIDKSQQDKLTGESEQQRQLLLNTQSKLQKTEDDLSFLKLKLLTQVKADDSLQMALSFYLSKYIESKKISVERYDDGVRVNFLENPYLSKTASNFEEWSMAVFDYTSKIMEADTFLNINIEREGIEIQKNIKKTDPKIDLNTNAPKLIINYLADKGRIKIDRMKIIFLFSNQTGKKENLHITIRHIVPN